MKRTNSSAVARRRANGGATSMRTAARERRARTPPRPVGSDGRSRAGGPRWGPSDPRPRRSAPAFGAAGPRVRSRPMASRCTDPGGLVADPNEDPDEQQRGVQRSVGLGQRADGQVVLVRPGVDAEHVPGQRDHDQRQPGRHAAERRSRASSPVPRPRVARRLQAPAQAAPVLPRQQCEVDEEHRDQGDQPRDLRRHGRPVVAAHPTAPGAQRESGNADDDTAATHGYRSIPASGDEAGHTTPDPSGLKVSAAR